MGNGWRWRWFAPLLFVLALLLPADALAAVPTTHLTKQCTTSSSEVYAASSVRTKLILQNISDTDIYINTSGGAAVVGAGIKILPGETYWDDILSSIPNSAITCIHGGSGNKALLGTQGSN